MGDSSSDWSSEILSSSSSEETTILFKDDFGVFCQCVVELSEMRDMDLIVLIDALGVFDLIEEAFKALHTLWDRGLMFVPEDVIKISMDSTYKFKLKIKELKDCKFLPVLDYHHTHHNKIFEALDKIEKAMELEPWFRFIYDISNEIGYERLFDQGLKRFESLFSTRGSRIMCRLARKDETYKFKILRRLKVYPEYTYEPLGTEHKRKSFVLVRYGCVFYRDEYSEKFIIERLNIIRKICEEYNLQVAYDSFRRDRDTKKLYLYYPKEIYLADEDDTSTPLERARTCFSDMLRGIDPNILSGYPSLLSRYSDYLDDYAFMYITGES